MRVLVTGCAGFVGSHLCDALLAAGHAVRGINALTETYDPARKLANLTAALRHRRFDLVVGDVGHADPGALLRGCDAVVHLAGEPGVRASFGARAAIYERRNVWTTARVASAVAKAPGVRLVHASSSSVYGDAAVLPTPEDAQPAPASPYAATKLAAEAAVRASGADATVLRLFSVYGPRQRPDMAFARFCAAAGSGAPIVVHGSGAQTRDFTYVDDVVGAIGAALVADAAVGATLNVGGGGATSVNAALEHLAALAGRPLDVRRGSPARGDVRRTSADVRTARAVLGWSPSTALADGLARQWHDGAAMRRQAA